MKQFYCVNLKAIFIFFVLINVFCLVATPSRAEETFYKFSFGVSGSYSFVTVSESGGFGTSESFHLKGGDIHLSTILKNNSEIRLTLGTSDFSFFNVRKGLQHFAINFELAYLFKFNDKQDKKFDPYLLGGVGWYKVYHVGGGVQYKVTPNVVIFTEAIGTTLFVFSQVTARAGIAFKF